MEMKERSKKLAKPDCPTCSGSGLVSEKESCDCTIRTFPDWKGHKVTKKPSDPFYEHDLFQRPG